MTTERDKVKLKIVALLAKTEQNGAGEHEALSASAKAAELMAHYDIEATELDFKSRSCVKKFSNYRKYGKKVIGNGFAIPVGRLCDCRIWGMPHENRNVFFGFEQDAEIAAYLQDTLCNAVLAELDAFQNSADYREAVANGTHGRTLSTSFLYGIEGRIGARINDMAKEKRATVKKATGNALVPVKEAQIESEFQDLGMRLRTSRTSHTIRSREALEAGRAAGNRVNINAGISGNAARGALQ